MWKSGFNVCEVPIVFEDRRVGQSKMSRKIFIEAFTWVIGTRLRGSPVVASAPVMHTELPTPPASDSQETQRQPMGGRP
jgi:hypothetical protein